jgi:SAM-dependent methyltransferase
VSQYDPAAFDAFESAGWQTAAALYDQHWSAHTSRLVDPLLDAAGVRAGLRVLDVGSGPGDAAGRAAERGAEATGVDVADAMVEIAGHRYPGARFVRASATELPFADESFDAGVGNFVILHIGEPARAVRELARVLVPGGRVALSTWDDPERSPFFAAILGAVADAGVPPPSDIPPGPSFFQFSDEAVFVDLLATASFEDVRVETFSLDLPLRSADELIAALAEGTVRTAALLRAADDTHDGRVRESLEARLSPWRRGDSFVVPASVTIASGRKPS